MTHTGHATSLALPVLAGLLAAPALAQAPASKPAAPKPAAASLVQQPWTGDLDGMIKRRRIRVLVPYNKTHYFIERGVQRGLAYEMGKKFEDDLNLKLKTGNMRVHVVFIPVSRDHMLPDLVAGKGDMAAASLTITPERQKLVDFGTPTFKDVSEIVVTGPRSPAIATVDDLAGQEVFVRTSSSYYESLTALNARFRQEGKKEVLLKAAPEALEDEDLLEMVNAGLVKTIVVDSHTAGFWQKVFPKLVLHPEVAVRTGGQIPRLAIADSRQIADFRSIADCR